MCNAALVLLICGAAFYAAWNAQAPSPSHLAIRAEGTLDPQHPPAYVFTVDEPGILTVGLRYEDGSDAPNAPAGIVSEPILTVVDTGGITPQLLSDGFGGYSVSTNGLSNWSGLDSEALQIPGQKQEVFVLPHRGKFALQIHDAATAMNISSTQTTAFLPVPVTPSFPGAFPTGRLPTGSVPAGPTRAYKLVAMFTPFQEVAGAGPLQIKDAIPLTLGQTVAGSSSARSHGALYSFQAARDQTVTVSTTNGSPDLVMHAFQGDLRNQVGRSDQDLNGTGSEALTVTLKTGEVCYFLVQPLTGRQATRFTIGVLPGRTTIGPPGQNPAGGSTPFPTGSFGGNTVSSSPSPLLQLRDLKNTKPFTVGVPSRSVVTPTTPWSLFEFAADRTGVVEFETVDASGDVILSAHDGQNLLELVRSDQDLNGDSGREIVRFNAVAGQTYFLLVEPNNRAATHNFELQARWLDTTRVP